LRALELRLGQKVADIGAGGGYFTLQFAKTVGNSGTVFAVDIDNKFLEIIKNSAKENNLFNVITILAEKDKPIFPTDSLDLIFMRNVCHHLTNRVKYFKQLKNSLKMDGKIVIIEYLGRKRFSFHRLFGHYVSKEMIIKEMKEAGYKLEKDWDFLPEQSFIMFSSQKFCMYLSGMYGY
jgi:ubiquinone/menaquinone biosynthesis C-methylase UbiE